MKRFFSRVAVFSGVLGLCLLVPAATPVSTVSAKNFFSRAPFRLTFYWTVTADKDDKNKKKSVREKLIPVVDLNLKLIGWGPESLIRRIAMEGSGYLPSGQLVNLACDCAYPHSRFFKVDTENAVWGLDARSKPLVPFQSVAVDPTLIPLGTKVFIPAFAGMLLPDGRRHTGCFVAGDVGYGIRKEHVDIFSGTEDSYKKVVKKLKSDYTFVYPGGENCPLVL